jgi:hypothetical protein
MDQQVMDQLDWGDHLVFSFAQQTQVLQSGWLCIHLIKENAMPPEQPA